MDINILSQDRLKELLHYNQETGEFIRTKAGKGFKVGDVAGYVITNKYIQITVDNKRYLAHRLVFKYLGIDLEGKSVDHIDGNRQNNRFENLRLATNKENCQNRRKASVRNKSGLLGAYYHKKSDKFISEIRLDDKKEYLGIFDTAEEAHQAYIARKREIHPFSTI
jgi:hypothetical protein